MQRRAYALLVGIALLMSGVAIVISLALGEPLRDPDGYLGPGWIRLPLLVLAAFLVDVVPRALYRARFRPTRIWPAARGLVNDHWTRERTGLVVIGMISFYLTYVSYRNLKNFLPFIGKDAFYGDRALHHFDQLVTFGHEPSVLLHGLLGSGIAAQILGLVYLLFLPVAPFSVIYFVVWSRTVSIGYWYVTTNCLAWTFGTISYYMIPSLGPAFAFPWLYTGLDSTGITSLQNSLWNSRADVMLNPFADGVQSVAGFASLHIGIILSLSLILHYVFPYRRLRIAIWVYFALTVVSTLYFGWHYIADDLAGALIALLSVWLGGLATGQRFHGFGRWVPLAGGASRVPVVPNKPRPPRVRA